ncbi:MAG TPA: acyl-ACP--UDP-N-acetylglucosamine O-acyltransferase [Nitrospiria bacterium]|nr:acyl-ACP--UDP-N-acetylglucosamine O-acyltransferase [Nitrospiria bacterium]
MDRHPTAIIHRGAVIEEGVTIGPYSVIGEHVRIGKGSAIGSHCVIDGLTEIGANCKFFPFSSIGAAPQDLKYRDEETSLQIGKNNTFREFVTVHRGTAGGHKKTVIGEDCFFMAYVHIAHDCVIGNRTVLANAATLAGHVEIGSDTVIGGLTAIHQFCRIGDYVMLGGASAVAQDIPHFVTASGNRTKLYGLNLIGLKRKGFTPERIDALKKAYKILFRSGMTFPDAEKKILDSGQNDPDVDKLVQFVKTSERGISR